MKLNRVDKIRSYFSAKTAARIAYARSAVETLEARAGYDAAGKGRRWFSSASTSQNAELQASLPILRDNSRELERNNPYAASATRVVVSTAIGGGIRPVARASSKKKKALADSLMRDWCDSVSCDHEGRLNLYGLQSLAMRTESLSGEALLIRRMIDDPNLPIPLTIQVLEGDYLDHLKNKMAEGAHTIQGVEFVGGRRTNYWLYNGHPGQPAGRVAVSRQLSADQVSHIYDVRRPGQVRGFPRGVAAFTRMKGLDDLKDARMEQQKIAALLAGFIYNEEGEGKGSLLPEKLEPGMLPKLDGAERIEFSNPPAVSGQHEMVSEEEHLIAAAWGITYEALVGDYKEVNFASGKMGRMQMFANVKRWRNNMMIPQFCRPVERWFIQAAALKGYDLRGVTFDWTPPKAEILDLKNELPSIINEVRSGLNSWQSACRERGLDPDRVAEELKQDAETFDRLGLVLDIDPRNTNRTGSQQTQKEAPTND